jgi:hypothetical protein
MSSYKVACFGAGFVGIPTSTVLALHNPHLKVPLSLSSFKFMTSVSHELKNVNKTNRQYLSLGLSRLWPKPTVLTFHLLIRSRKPLLMPQLFFWHCQPRQKHLEKRRERLTIFPTLKMLLDHW